MDKQLNPYVAIGLQSDAKERLHKKYTQELNIIEIGRIVAKYYGINFEQMTAKTRKQEYLWPRQVTHYFADKIFEKKTYREIGRIIGLKDHATVMWSCIVVSNLYDTEKEIKKEIDELYMLIRERKTPE